jgi:hypothetical protein
LFNVDRQQPLVNRRRVSAILFSFVVDLFERRRRTSFDVDRGQFLFPRHLIEFERRQFLDDVTRQCVARRTVDLIDRRRQSNVFLDTLSNQLFEYVDTMMFDGHVKQSTVHVPFQCRAAEREPVDDMKQWHAVARSTRHRLVLDVSTMTRRVDMTFGVCGALPTVYLDAVSATIEKR